MPSDPGEQPGGAPSLKLYAERHGAGGPTLVFVHGFCCNGSDWEHQVRRFMPSHQVLVPDLRGHGWSPAFGECTVQDLIDDTAALVEAEVSGPCVMIGHSMGCRVVLGVGQSLPERVIGLVFVDGSSVGSGDPDGAAAAVAARLRDDGITATLRCSFEQMFVPGSDETLRDAIVQRALAMPAHVVETLMPDVFRWDTLNLRSVLSTIGQPVMALQSTRVDQTAVRVPIASEDGVPWLELLREHVRQLGVEIIAGAGHFSMIERPTAVNAAIEKFISSLPA
jgi:pimeloyl-ACP methyl ester carboxylesterase